MIYGIGAALSVVLSANDKPPDPSVVKTWPDVPPVIVTLPMGPSSVSSDTIRFTGVTLPMLLTTSISESCPTENPDTELNDRNAIVIYPLNASILRSPNS